MDHLTIHKPPGPLRAVVYRRRESFITDSYFYDLLACGHQLFVKISTADKRKPAKRRCWKCERGYVTQAQLELMKADPTTVEGTKCITDLREGRRNYHLEGRLWAEGLPNGMESFETYWRPNGEHFTIPRFSLQVPEAPLPEPPPTGDILEPHPGLLAIVRAHTSTDDSTPLPDHGQVQDPQD